jgi:hypothetical protein
MKLSVDLVVENVRLLLVEGIPVFQESLGDGTVVPVLITTAGKKNDVGNGTVIGVSICSGNARSTKLLNRRQSSDDTFRLSSLDRREYQKSGIKRSHASSKPMCSRSFPYNPKTNPELYTSLAFRFVVFWL